MCGITAVINQLNQSVAKDELVAANDLIKHRGPDAEGYYLWNQVGLGHRRLAIIDVSEKGHQPMFYQDRYALIYNGEIYNYKELRNELQEANYAFSSQSDTEVILAAYDYWGAECLHQFNGMWAFVLLDKKTKTVFAARDRFGIKPLYYTKLEEQFCLGSEIKQFTKIKGWRAVMNRDRLFDFLTKDYHDHTEETLFKGVYQLPPGYQLSYDLTTHEWTKTKYYDLVAKTQTKSKVDFEEAKNKIHDLIHDAAQLRLRADVKVGATLSGGLDSAALVGVVTNAANTEQPKLETVSVVFPGLAIDEASYIAEVAKRSNSLSHTTTPQANELEEQLKRAIWFQDEPFGSASILAQQAVFELAAEKRLPVVLGGQGADEIFAGYEVFYRPYFSELWRARPIQFLRELIIYFRKNGFSILNKMVQSRAKKKKADYGWLQAGFIPDASRQYDPPQRDTILRISQSALQGFGMPLLLHYEDRNSMSHSIESRLPFLDYRLVEYCLSLPADFKIHKTIRKYILRESMKELLPEKIYRRYDKIGFEAPQESWMSDNVEFIQTQLAKIQTQFPAIFTDEVVQIKNPRLVWRLLCFSGWVEIFAVQVE